MRALRVMGSCALLALAACTDAPSPATAPVWRSGPAVRPSLVDELGNSRLAVDVELEPGSPAVAGLVTVGGPDMKWPVEAKLERGESGELLGTIAVPPGEARWVALRVFDGGGEETHAGEGVFAVDRELTPQLELTLQPRTVEALRRRGVGELRPPRLRAHRVAEEAEPLRALLPGAPLLPPDGIR